MLKESGSKKVEEIAGNSIPETWKETEKTGTNGATMGTNSQSRQLSEDNETVINPLAPRTSGESSSNEETGDQPKREQSKAAHSFHDNIIDSQEFDEGIKNLCSSYLFGTTTVLHDMELRKMNMFP